METASALCAASPITANELRGQLQKTANGKSADSKGVVMELLKHSGDDFLEIVAQVFTDILDPVSEIPEYWKQTRLKVLFKKGDPQLPDNYRPISILPILYKLFSKVLCARIKGILIAQQSVDQAGFRPGFACDDHLFVITIITEMFAEFRQPLLIVAVDFRKAFDSINHADLWSALIDQGVSKTYVHFLRKLYSGQSGVVQTDCVSKKFGIGRGTRQGDPISPILFNAALEALMRRLCAKWFPQQACGIDINGRKLTNLRFADDLLLFSHSLEGAKQMLADLMSVASRFGLEVHEDKTKIVWNGQGVASDLAKVKIRGRFFEVLGPTSSTMYLGRLFSFEQTHDREIRNRITKAWAKFSVFRSELTDRHYNLAERVKLFKSTVQPTLLYGCACWTMTRDRESTIRALQRKMMRSIIGTRRVVGEQGLESWVEWVVRSTRIAEQTMVDLGVADWVEEVHRRRFRWAGRASRVSDGRWTKEVLQWSAAGARKRGRPRCRWADQLNKFFKQGLQAPNEFWLELAQEKQSWDTLENDYVNFALGQLSDA